MKIIYLESNLFEKSNTKPDKQAMKTLVSSGLFSEEESKSIIDDLFTNKKVHAFTHSDPWMDKYIKGIARMIVEEANGDKAKAEQFIGDSKNIDTLNEYLKYVKEVRNKQDNPADFDKEFVDKLSFNDVKDFIEKYQDELDKRSEDELKKMEFSSSNYEIVPIESFDELHSKFGGKLTGDGSSDKYAGRGGTAWCHANSEFTYDAWINDGKGKNKFFILMNKNFKDIPFNPKTNKEMEGKDDYGNSLIALVVDRYGNLKYATLRCNHVGVLSNADNQYKTYAELSKIAGFNVEDKVKVLGNFEESPVNLVKDGVYIYNGGKVDNEIKEFITKVIISEEVTEISVGAFSNCTNLLDVVFNCTNLKAIRKEAFWHCISLKNLVIPDTVEVIGEYAFGRCHVLTTIRFPEKIVRIPKGIFLDCFGLKTIQMSDNITVIESSAFSGCRELELSSLPNGLVRIGYLAFQECRNLKIIDFPEHLSVIEECAFRSSGLQSVTLHYDIFEIGNGAFSVCPKLRNFSIYASSVKFGGRSIFRDSDKVVVKCPEHSDMELYCEYCDVRCEYL